MGPEVADRQSSLSASCAECMTTCGWRLATQCCQSLGAVCGHALLLWLGTLRIRPRLQAHEEVDRVLGEKAQPEVADYQQLRYLMRCVNESMRLYPHPPVLLRRAQIQDELPGGMHYACCSSRPS